MLVDMPNNPLVHQQNMRSTTDIRMNRHRKDELVVLSIEVIEMIHPYRFDISWVHPSMAIGAVFDEPGGRQASFPVQTLKTLTSSEGGRQCTTTLESPPALWSVLSPAASSILPLSWSSRSSSRSHQSAASTFDNPRDSWNGHTQYRRKASAQCPHDLSPTTGPRTHGEAFRRSRSTIDTSCPTHLVAARVSYLLDSRGCIRVGRFHDQHLAQQHSLPGSFLESGQE